MTEEKSAPEELPVGQGSAKFAELEAKHGLAPAEPVETPAEDPVEEPEVVADKVEEPSKDGEQTEQDAATSPELSKALGALRRAKTPQSVIDSLDNSAALEWGLKLAESQAAADRLSSELGTLKADREPAEANGEEPVQPTGQPIPFDFDEAGQPLSDNFSEDEAGAFVGLVKGATEAVQAAAMQRIGVLQDQLGELLLTDAMRQLEGQFPPLAEPTGRDAVRAKIEQLNVAQYGSIRDLVLDASRLAGLDNLSANDGAARDPDLSSRRDRGRTKTTHAKVKPKTLTDAERRRKAYRDLERKHGLA
jgi:hypothetical protein